MQLLIVLLQFHWKIGPWITFNPSHCVCGRMASVWQQTSHPRQILKRYCSVSLMVFLFFQQCDKFMDFNSTPLASSVNFFLL